MTHKRRSRRQRRTQKGGAKKSVNPDICKGLPYLVNGFEYTTKTSEYVKGDYSQVDYKSFLDGTCKPIYVVSTTRISSYSLKGSFILMKNPEKLSLLVKKWIALLKPISASVIGSSVKDIALQRNVNPFKTYYDQLKLYNSILDNKSGILNMVTRDTELIYSDENILETFNGIRAQYNYYSDIPFNMKEFLGFEKIGGWMGTESGRIKTMKQIDEEVGKFSGNVVPNTNYKEDLKKNMEKELTIKTQASKALMILMTFVFCYLNYIPIPKGDLDMDTINRMTQTLNKLYEQINRFSSVKGTPEQMRTFLQTYVSDFNKNLKELKEVMSKKTAKPIVGGALSNVPNPVINSKQAEKLGPSPTSGIDKDEEEPFIEEFDDYRPIPQDVRNMEVKNVAEEQKEESQDKEAPQYVKKETKPSRRQAISAKISADQKVFNIVKDKIGIESATKEAIKTAEEAEKETEKAEKAEEEAGKRALYAEQQADLKKKTSFQLFKSKEQKEAEEGSKKAKENLKEAQKETLKSTLKSTSSKKAINTVKNVVLGQIREDAKETQELAKQYEPKFQTIPIERKSDDYKIAENELNKALTIYKQDKNNGYEDIVTSRYQTLLDIAKKEHLIANHENRKEKEKIKDTVQKDLEDWTNILGIKKALGTKNKLKLKPDQVDAEIIRLKISLKNTNDEIKGIGLDPSGNLTQAIKDEESAKEELEKAETEKSIANKNLEIKTGLNKDQIEKAEEAEEAKKIEKENLTKFHKDALEYYYERTQKNEEAKLAAEKATEARETVKQTSKKLEDASQKVKGMIPSDVKDKVKFEPLVDLLRKQNKLTRKIEKLNTSSDLQRGFLSDTLSYEKTIAYLYRPKDTNDPLKKFYEEIQKVVDFEIDKLYEFLKPSDLFDGNENVSDLDLKTFITRYADKSGKTIKELEAIAKKKEKDLEPEDIKILKNLRGLEKQNKIRARTHFFMKPLYFTVKKLQKAIQHKEEIKFGKNEHTFDSGTFKKDRLGGMKQYIKERARSETLFSMYPKTLKKDYKFVRLYNSEEYKQANAMLSLKEVPLENVFENTAYFKDRGFVFIKDPAKLRGMFVKYYYDEDDYVNGEQLLKPEFTKKEVVKGFLQFGQEKTETPPEPAYEELGKEKKSVFDALPGKNYGKTREVIKNTTELIKSAPKAASNAYEEGKTVNVEKEKKIIKRMSQLNQSHEIALRKEQINQITQKGGVIGIGSGLLTGAKTLAKGVVYGAIFIPFSIFHNVIGNAIDLTIFSAGQLKDLADDSSYLRLGMLATKKREECEKILEMLNINLYQVEDERINQLLLSVLYNIYNALDYIEKTEEKFRDRHGYTIDLFKPYIENLILKIKKNPFAFGESKLYASMNDAKKMLYFVYHILQQCKPKTLADVKKGIIEGIDNEENVLDKQIQNLKKELLTSAEDKKEELNKQIKELEDKKQIKEKTQELDDEIKQEDQTSAEILKKNEKPVKEILKKANKIVFDDKEMNEIFTTPKTYIVKRHSSDSKMQLVKRLDVMPEVSIIAPDHVPALASIFVYRTGVDPDQKEKNEEAAAKAVVSKAKADAKAAEKKIKDAASQEETKIKKGQNFELEKEKLKQKGQIDLSTLEGRTKLQLKEKEIEKEIKLIRERHKVQVESSEMKYRQEMSRFSAETAQANKLSKDESKKELARIAEDKKRSESQHKLEIDKFNAELAIALEKAKSGSKMSNMESEPVIKGYSTKNTTANRSNRNRTNTNTIKNVTMKIANKTGKTGKEQTVCINGKCYTVNIDGNGKKISINPMPQ